MSTPSVTEPATVDNTPPAASSKVSGFSSSWVNNVAKFGFLGLQILRSAPVDHSDDSPAVPVPEPRRDVVGAERVPRDVGSVVGRQLPARRTRQPSTRRRRAQRVPRHFAAMTVRRPEPGMGPNASAVASVDPAAAITTARRLAVRACAVASTTSAAVCRLGHTMSAPHGGWPSARRRRCHNRTRQDRSPGRDDTTATTRPSAWSRRTDALELVVACDDLVGFELFPTVGAATSDERSPARRRGSMPRARRAAGRGRRE